MILRGATLVVSLLGNRQIITGLPEEISIGKLNSKAMIENGYNGIEFGKYSEQYFLNHVSMRYLPLLSRFTHRDTQERGDLWKVQGTISIEDFNIALEEMHGISNITKMSFAFPFKDKYLLTLNIIKI